MLLLLSIKNISVDTTMCFNILLGAFGNRDENETYQEGSAKHENDKTSRKEEENLEVESLAVLESKPSIEPNMRKPQLVIFCYCMGIRHRES